jgi:hypothetical protein
LRRTGKREFGAYLRLAAMAAGGFGISGPLLAFYLHVVPPSQPELALLAVPLSGVVLIHAYQSVSRVEKRLKRNQPAQHRFALWAIAASLLIAICYLALLNLTTVVDPRDHVRFQIGFGTSDIGLTSFGQRWKSEHRYQAVQEWMMDNAAFVGGGPQRLWTSGTIALAASCLDLLYFAAFCIWTWAFGVLAALGRQTKRE